MEGFQCCVTANGERLDLGLWEKLLERGVVTCPDSKARGSCSCAARIVGFQKSCLESCSTHCRCSVTVAWREADLCG